MSYKSQKDAKRSNYAKTVDFMEKRMINIIHDAVHGKRTVHQDELPPCETNEDGERCWTF